MVSEDEFGSVVSVVSYEVDFAVVLDVESYNLLFWVEVEDKVNPSVDLFGEVFDELSGRSTVTSNSEIGVVRAVRLEVFSD